MTAADLLLDRDHTARLVLTETYHDTAVQVSVRVPGVGIMSVDCGHGHHSTDAAHKCLRRVAKRWDELRTGEVRHVSVNGSVYEWKVANPSGPGRWYMTRAHIYPETSLIADCGLVDDHLPKTRKPVSSHGVSRRFRG